MHAMLNNIIYQKNILINLIPVDKFLFMLFFKKPYASNLQFIIISLSALTTNEGDNVVSTTV